jgi:2-polyprenyl-3-methyl-5-hydroxy-6-metoxy-1,4-benzoquinol methylase
MVHCLICKATEAQLVASTPRRDLVDRWHRTFNVDIETELMGLDPVTEWRCPGCGLGFFPPAGAGSAGLYEQLCRFPWYYIPAKWEHEMAMADLRPGDRVLEVGCGVGAFVDRLRKAGWEASGLELNGAAVAQAQAAGVPVVNELIETVAAREPGAFDLVCSFEVLEHVADPYDFIDQQVRALRPGGRLVIGVPNQDSYIRHEDNLLNMPPHHVSRWSARALQNLTAVFPLRLIRLATEPLQHYHVRGYTRVLMAPLRRLALPGRAAAWALGGAAALTLTGSGLYRRLMGQTIYACLERTDR